MTCLSSKVNGRFEIILMLSKELYKCQTCSFIMLIFKCNTKLLSKKKKCNTKLYIHKKIKKGVILNVFHFVCFKRQSCMPIDNTYYKRNKEFACFYYLLPQESMLLIRTEETTICSIKVEHVRRIGNTKYYDANEFIDN